MLAARTAGKEENLARRRYDGSFEMDEVRFSAVQPQGGRGMQNCVSLD
jgi:hypothetical protein